MLRVVSLLIVLTHLSVASIPCVGPGTADETHISTAASKIHPLRVPAPPQPVTSDAHPGDNRGYNPGHNAAHNAASDTGAADIHRQHAAVGSVGGSPDHSDHADHTKAGEALRAGATAQVEIAVLELHAPCFCGCNKSTNSQGTTSSPRLGFALFPPRPTSLPEATPSFHAAEMDPMPAAFADLLDHVPILS